ERLALLLLVPEPSIYDELDLSLPATKVLLRNLLNLPEILFRNINQNTWHNNTMYHILYRFCVSSLLAYIVRTFPTCIYIAHLLKLMSLQHPKPLAISQPETLRKNHSSLMLSPIITKRRPNPPRHPRDQSATSNGNQGVQLPSDPSMILFYSMK